MPAAVKVAFDGSSVVATGLTPGGQAVVFSEALEVSDYVATYVRREQIVTADASGLATYDLGKAVPEQSVWVVVDLASGASSGAAPAGFPLVLSGFHGQGVVRSAASAPDGLADTRPFLEVLVVRPGAAAAGAAIAAGEAAGTATGAWGSTVGDGGLLDEDGQADGVLHVSLGKMRAVGGSGPPPDRFAAGDVVVAVEPSTMQLTLATLPGGKP